LVAVVRSATKERQQRERLGCRECIDGPPDRVAAVVARTNRGLVTEWALVARKRGECDTALARIVAMMKQVAGHECSLSGIARYDIRAAP
jgi:hypothetical protein